MPRPPASPAAVQRAKRSSQREKGPRFPAGAQRRRGQSTGSERRKLPEFQKNKNMKQLLRTPQKGTVQREPSHRQRFPRRLAFVREATRLGAGERAMQRSRGARPSSAPWGGRSRGTGCPRLPSTGAAGLAAGRGRCWLRRELELAGRVSRASQHPAEL